MVGDGVKEQGLWFEVACLLLVSPWLPFEKVSQYFPIFP